MNLPIDHPSNESVELARKHPRWPAMKRVQDDHVVLVGDRWVWKWHADDDEARCVAARSWVRPLADFTVPVEYVGGGWTRREYIDGECPARQERVHELLLELHKAGGAKTARRCGDEFKRRVMERVRKNHPANGNLCALEFGCCSCWPEVGSWGAWHGDPTVTNAVGRWLIDHSPAFEGYMEYDFAKLRRCSLIGDDGQWMGNPRDFVGDKWLAVVLAGMIGSHAVGEFRDRLIDAFRRITRTC